MTLMLPRFTVFSNSVVHHNHHKAHYSISIGNNKKKAFIVFLINTVYYMAPFATMILAVPALVLEGSGVVNWLQTHEAVLSSMMMIFSSGVLAFCLNFSIFYVIHSTTAVTFNVAGNLKVAVAVLISWLIFRNPISIMNSIGCTITLAGCTFYGIVRQKLSQQPGTPQTPRTPRSLVELLPLVNEKEDKA